MSIWVTLTEEQIAEADRVGAAFHAARVKARSVHKNNRALNYAFDLEGHKAAARCELAAHIGLQTRSWNNEPLLNLPSRKQADLDGFIDVKQRKQSWRDLLIQFDDPAEFAYVSVCSEQHPDYSIDGWCWGSAVNGRFRGELVPGRPCYVIPMAALIIRSPHELKEIVRQRQAEAAL